jgi:hypothetical protein
MFLFKKHKKLGHKQTATVGFVLAVMSILVTAITVYAFPILTAWLYTKGVYSLDMFLLIFVVTMYISLQALILFGFPLFYAQDKKCHMTGFRILLYALGWELLIVLLVAVITALISGQSMEAYTIGDFDLDAIQPAETVELVE